MTNESKQQLIVWWVLWAAFQAGIVMIYFVLGGGTSKTVATPNPLWVAALVPFLLSMVFRWIVLPRQQSAQAALPWFVIGMAFAETVCLLGLFIFPVQRQLLFAVSLIGIFQFIPFFASRYLRRNDELR